MLQDTSDAVWKFLLNGGPVIFHLWRAKTLKHMKPMTLVRNLMPQSLSMFDPIVAVLYCYRVFDMYWTLAREAPSWRHQHMSACYELLRSPDVYPPDQHELDPDTKTENTKAVNQWKDARVNFNSDTLRHLYGGKKSGAATKKNSLYFGRYSTIGTARALQCNPAVISKKVGHTSFDSQVR